MDVPLTYADWALTEYQFNHHFKPVSADSDTDKMILLSEFIDMTKQQRTDHLPFIWAINPSKDSAIELFILLRDFGDELFDETDIQFSVEGLKEEYKDYLLNMDLKRQLVLIFKEAMNNALKHSDCTKVIFKIEECKKRIKISLTDNGNGFILNHKKFGYGLGSMFNRSKKVGGQLEVNTKIGVGTEILFTS